MQRFLEPHGLRERGMCKDEEHVVRCSYIRYLAKTFHNDSVSQQADIEQIGLWNVRTTASRRATHLDFSQSLHCKKFPDNNKPHEKGFSQSKTLHIIFKYGERVFSLLLKTLLGSISLLNPQTGFVIGCNLLNP